MTFNSGYLTVTSSNETRSAIEANSYLTVNGGCITAASTTNNGISGKLELNGGYVKATGAVNGVAAGDDLVTVNGGYLEASGKVGIYADVKNTNGVIKATGSDGNGITGHVACTGGVTIASGKDVAAISGNITDTSATPTEKYWTSLTPESTDTGTALSSTAVTLDSANTNVVIAKTALTAGNQATASMAPELNGAYIYNTSPNNGSNAWNPSAAATVTGGSYIYGTCPLAFNLEISGTLVSETAINKAH